MKVRNITLGAMFLAIALTVFVIESRIPAPVPVPGFKMGLSNVITLITLYLWDKKYSFAVLMMRIVLGSVICGSGVMLLYSSAGGIACFIALLAMKETMVWAAVPVVSMISAVVHNAAQLLAAALVLGSFAVFVYFPLLCSVGLASGLFTGIAAKACMKSKAVLNLFNKGYKL